MLPNSRRLISSAVAAQHTDAGFVESLQLGVAEVGVFAVDDLAAYCVPRCQVALQLVDVGQQGFGAVLY
jgi:hypothetical protein